MSLQRDDLRTPRRGPTLTGPHSPRPSTSMDRAQMPTAERERADRTARALVRRLAARPGALPSAPPTDTPSGLLGDRGIRQAFVAAAERLRVSGLVLARLEREGPLAEIGG